MIPVREFTSADELRTHYRAVDARMAALRPPAPKPSKVRVIDVTGKAWKAQRIRDAERALDEWIATADRAVIAGRTPPRRIIAEVAARHGLTRQDILGEGRSAAVVRARYEAIAEVRRVYPDKSLIWLGMVFERDHSTIIHALRRMGGE